MGALPAQVGRHAAPEPVNKWFTTSERRAAAQPARRTIYLWLHSSLTRSSVPECRDAILTRESEDALWQSFFTAAPAPSRPDVLLWAVFGDVGPKPPEADFEQPTTP
jgi:hypothetical protein